MNNSKFQFWQKWLTWANVLTMGIGLLVAFGGNSIFFKIHNDFTREVFFDGKEITGSLLLFKNWLFGIIGGTIVGFHFLMIMISENAFKKKEKWAYNALWGGLLFWFIIDSSISIFYGALYNVILINLFALVLIGVPLLKTHTAFSKK